VEVKKSYLAMIKAFAGGWDAMAGALGMSRMALENRIYERKGQAILVETAMAMQAFSGTTLFAEEVARESSGVFICIPSFNGISDIELLDAYTAMVEDEGTFAKDFREALKDGKITQEEFERLRDDMRREQAHEMELLARIESMIVFEP
jgi:hypothetical protein